MVPDHHCIFPMFAENFAKDRVLGLDMGAHKGELMANAKAVYQKDKFYVRNSDLVVANFLGFNDRISKGSIIELARADAYGIPYIIVSEPDNPNLHCMINEGASWMLNNLEDAATVVNGLFGACTPKVNYWSSGKKKAA
jgi:hypothetical protein